MSKDALAGERRKGWGGGGGEETLTGFRKKKEGKRVNSRYTSTSRFTVQSLAHFKCVLMVNREGGCHWRADRCLLYPQWSGGYFCPACIFCFSTPFRQPPSSSHPLPPTPSHFGRWCLYPSRPSPFSFYSYIHLFVRLFVYSFGPMFSFTVFCSPSLFSFRIHAFPRIPIHSIFTYRFVVHSCACRPVSPTPPPLPPTPPPTLPSSFSSSSARRFIPV